MSANETADAPTVRRLHPGTIGITLLRQAPSTLLGLPAILALMSDTGLLIAIAIAAVGMAVAGIFAWLNWSRFTYAIGADSVVIESGVFSRNRRVIPFARVQDVDIERKPLHRLFGLAKVTLETGGSGDDEGDLDSVGIEEAQRLRAVVRARATGAIMQSAAQPAEAAASPRSRVLYAMSLSRVLGWGLFNFSLIWLAVIFGALQYVEDWTSIDLYDRDLWEMLRDRSARYVVASAAWVALAAALGLLGVAAGLIRTLLRDYGFTVADEGGRYRRTRGLLTHSEAVIALPRVQLARIDTGWPRRRLGWMRLRVQTLATDDKARMPEIAPFARGGEVDTLLAPLALERVHPALLERVSSGHVVRAILRQVGVPAAAIVIAALFAPAALLLGLLLIPALALALLRRRYHRFALIDGILHVQRGVLTRQTWIVPPRNVQAVTIRRGPVQRLLGLSTVVADTAGAPMLGGVMVQDVAHDRAWALAAALREARLAASAARSGA
ncbi:PH domain-containing protein [Sphingomonas baiyangensis]|uniref:YdbS-like PH domain-containing protein n=1 Tax=Sphingomonas baiyangensis TaxID=2572576 RepID=A0A4U1L5X8_9SPHN|nr:PH domain-containing protein [Sphingomonas baiyangensis]TKD51645.1 hypothetical protein FBR43_13425 [Sphingomonas baiyangensis]